MRVDNQPYGRLNEIIYDNAFTTHPYKHPTIGSMADLEAASIEDVREFFQTYYVPENATLVIVGDFDMAQAKELVTQYFGRVPKAEQAGAARHSAEPPQAREKRVTVEAPWPLPAVVVALSHHLRRPSRFVSAAHRVEGAVGRPELAHLSEAGLRKSARGGGVRRREPDRASEPVLRGRDRAAGPDARRCPERADRRARSAEGGADHRTRAAAHQEPVRPRLHPRAGVESAEGHCSSRMRR